MKKFALLGVVVFIIYIVFCLRYGKYIHISSKIEINIPLSAKLEYIDTHGGFHGDGETFAKVYLTEKQSEKVKKNIENNENWKRLPMSENLQNDVGQYLTAKMNMPSIENGYWFFLDRNSEAYNKYDENEMYKEKRYSSNFSVAVFDIDTNILYYHETDT